MNPENQRYGKLIECTEKTDTLYPFPTIKTVGIKWWNGKEYIGTWKQADNDADDLYWLLKEAYWYEFLQRHPFVNWIYKLLYSLRGLYKY